MHWILHRFSVPAATDRTISGFFVVTLCQHLFLTNNGILVSLLLEWNASERFRSMAYKFLLSLFHNNLAANALAVQW